MKKKKVLYILALLLCASGDAPVTGVNSGDTGIGYGGGSSGGGRARSFGGYNWDGWDDLEDEEE